MAKKNLPIYKITIDPEYAEDGEDLGIEQIAFTANPAIKVKGMAFSSQVKPVFFSDDLKYRITAPALIPMEIYRFDEDTDQEYYVKFSQEEIEKIHAKFMREMVNRDLFNLEHDQSKTVPAYVLEAWIVDTPKEDKAYSSFGIEVPEGTLMVTAQVTDKEYYAELVAQEQIGFSIEGYLGMKLKEQTKTNIQMNKLPDGEHLIEGKIYVVKDGEVIEIREAQQVEASEEVALEDTVIEETVKEEMPAEEATMAIDPAVDTEAILAIVKPAMDEQMNTLLQMIADLKTQLEDLTSTEVEEETVSEAVAMSVQQRFSNVNKFINK
jgi:rRNA maturation endonuclease Nob1